MEQAECNNILKARIDTCSKEIKRVTDENLNLKDEIKNLMTQVEKLKSIIDKYDNNELIMVNNQSSIALNTPEIQNTTVKV